MIRLTGHLICADAAEADRVAAHLPAHVAETRAEPGCLSFEITPTTDPLVWAVSEAFRDRAAFEAHQRRAAASPWADATRGLRRDYTVTEAPS